LARYLVDTDVFVDHLRNGVRVPVPPAESAYSTITRAELYAGHSVNERVVDTLLSAFEEIGVERHTSEAAGRIRRSSDVALPDAIIAATAIADRRQLVTKNLRHFRTVRGLRLFRQRT
jgi:predicted nucleic acid-binding protein